MIKLSIIVPVYGVEKYIYKCISSLLVPGFQDYEIVVVNDGTRDSSIDIVKEKFDDRRIKIIEQENQGLSVARNTGIMASEGEYLWFFDSDDWAQTNLIPDITSKLDSIDVLYFPKTYIEHEDNGKTIFRDTGSCALTKPSFFAQKYLHPAPYYIYKKEVLESNRLCFEKNLYHEDTLFTPCALYYCNTFLPYQEPVYHYLQRSGSITKTLNDKRITDLIIIVNKLLKFGEETVSPSLRYIWGNCIAEATNELLNLSVRFDNKELTELISLTVDHNKQLLEYIVHSSKWNTRIMGYLAKLLGGNLHQVYSFLYKFRY